MRSHTNERPFACSEPDCDKTFPRKDHLQRHVKNAHSDPVVERTCTCDWRGCGKSFTSHGRLQRHKEAHESKFYCTGYGSCNEAFRKEKALKAHIKSQHLEVKPYPCTFVHPESDERCANGYQTDGALQRHMSKVHLAEQENGLFCMLCAEPGAECEGLEFELIAAPMQPISFATQEELTAHVKERHPPECVECGQKFKSESTLKSHIDTIHADPSLQPKFPCPNPDCDSVFNRKHNLTVHIQSVHEKQTKFSCTPNAVQNSKHGDLKTWNGANACGAAFKAKSSLDQHIRTHHLGLGNRKQLRKAAKTKKKPEASMLSMLTGVGYEKNREVPCLAQPCDHRFYMDRDLRRHLRAVHHIPEHDIEEMIAERDALTGGQFWIGGLEESLGMYDSTEPSMPQTPVPYCFESALATSMGVAGEVKSLDQQLHFLDQMRLFDEEAQMDVAMGLGDLAPAADVQQGLQWEMLEPVEQFNTDHHHG